MLGFLMAPRETSSAPPGKNNTPDIGLNGTAALPKNVAGFTGCNRVSAALGFSHHCESGFLVNLERLKGSATNKISMEAFKTNYKGALRFWGW